ncbi:LysM domain-containing protein [Brevibacillus sp. AG]|uniref:LysM peptidoglycan-binding domain-containing protein n=1 Tax=Brevibacillus sp. AG TaxID=3020891 RepID=UPI00233020B1|nr:LysM domain-containing protein [Brevibacillus sp. AG]MDC0764158.1 LysM domain-containing protein [Brevibacillus sp. AG]
MWAVLVLMALSFYAGSLTVNQQETELLVPDTPNYTIQPGDTVSEIAQSITASHDIGINEAIDALIRINKERGREIDGTIYPGQNIFVPLPK